MKPHFLKLKPCHSVCLSISFVIGSIGLVETVQAKELYFQPSINIQTEYDSNKRLRTERTLPGIDPSSYGVISKVNADVGVRSERYNVALKNQFILNRYESDLDLDSEDFKLNLTSGYTLTQKSQIGLNASYIYDTTLTSELDGSGSGIVDQDNVRRRQWSVTPTWSYSFSNTQFFQASYSHSEVDYDDSEIGTFSNYTIDNWATSFQQQWTPLFSNFISLSAMSFKVPKTVSGFFETSQDITEYSVSLGANYQIRPTWSTSFSVGSRFTNTESTTKIANRVVQQTEADNIGFIFSAEVEKTFEAGVASISLSRSTNPQGQGRLQVRNHIEAYFKHKFTERLQFSVGGSFNDISTSGAEDDGNARTYYDVKPSIKWLVDQQASVTLGYRYRTQSFDREEQAAVSNSVSLSFNYQWDKITTQRY